MSLDRGISMLLGAIALAFLGTVAFWPVEPAVEEEAAALPGSGAAAGDATTGRVLWADEGPSLSVRLECQTLASGARPPVRIELAAAAGRGPSRQSDPLSTAASSQHRVPLPEERPALPLRLRLLSDDYCIRPGVQELLVPSLDTTLVLALVERRDLEVVVVDESDAPIESAILRHHGGAELGRTDAQGRAVVSTPAQDALCLSAHAAGFAVGAVPVAAGAVEPRRLALRRQSEVGRVEVRVVDGRQAPIEGATLSWRWTSGLDATEPAGPALEGLRTVCADHPDLDVVFRKAKSDDRGRVTITLPFAGTLEVQAHHPVHGRSPVLRIEAPADPGGGSALEARLAYPAEEGLLVAVRTPEGPRELCPIELVGAAEARILKAGRTDERGELFFGVEALQDCFVVARPLKGEIAVRRVGEEQRERGRLDIQLGQGAALTARLPWLAGAEAYDRQVEVRDAESDILIRTVPGAIDGSVAIDRLPVGRELVLMRLADRDSGLRLATIRPTEDGQEMELGELARPTEEDGGE